MITTQLANCIHIHIRIVNISATIIIIQIVDNINSNIDNSNSNDESGSNSINTINTNDEKTENNYNSLQIVGLERCHISHLSDILDPFVHTIENEEEIINDVGKHGSKYANWIRMLFDHEKFLFCKEKLRYYEDRSDTVQCIGADGQHNHQSTSSSTSFLSLRDFVDMQKSVIIKCFFERNIASKLTRMNDPKAAADVRKFLQEMYSNSS